MVRKKFGHESEQLGLSKCRYLQVKIASLATCVRPEPKIPEELKLLYFGTENFDQFRSQSI